VAFQFSDLDSLKSPAFVPFSYGNRFQTFDTIVSRPMPFSLPYAQNTVLVLLTTASKGTTLKRNVFPELFSPVSVKRHGILGWDVAEFYSVRLQRMLSYDFFSCSVARFVRFRFVSAQLNVAFPLKKLAGFDVDIAFGACVSCEATRPSQHLSAALIAHLILRCAPSASSESWDSRVASD
jgi:hypothetical protein